MIAPSRDAEEERVPDDSTEARSGGPAGIDPADLPAEDLIRELQHLHETRHDTFLFGSDDALAMHTRRTAELEAEYVRRHPGRLVSAERVREGARRREARP
jgi:hypothetical protein